MRSIDKLGTTVFGLLILSGIAIFLLSKFSRVNNDGYRHFPILNYHRVETITPVTDDPFDDLFFLKERIKEKKIIVVGESTHNDGNTFSAKSRLIHFFHQEMGFNRLAFEAGRYDMWLLNDSEDFDPNKSIYRFWAQSDKMQYLWEYVRTNHISLDGFDVQCTGNMADSERKDLLFSYLVKGIKDAETRWNDLYGIMDSLQYYMNMPERVSRLSEKRKEKVFEDIESIINFLERSESTQENDVYIAYLNNMKDWWSCISQYKMGDNKRFEIRDSLMMENLSYILEDAFSKGEKLIIWTSNLHAFKDNHQCPDSSKNFTNLGERLQERFQDEIYTITFTSYCRTDGKNIYGHSPSNSLEHYLHESDIPYLYLDNIKSSNFKTGINQNIYYCYDIGKMTDGLFYIDTESDALNDRAYECDSNR